VTSPHFGWGSNPTPCTNIERLAILFELKKQGKKESTLSGISKRLRHLDKNVKNDNHLNSNIPQYCLVVTFIWVGFYVLM